MVRIVQCLCGPARHCILGIAYADGLTAAQAEFGGFDDITLTEANAAGYVRGMVEGLLLRLTLNPWCGICFAPSTGWLYEDAPTKFKSIEEATPHLKRVEEANQQAREMIDAVRRKATQN